MEILMVAAELGPYVTATDAADAVASLSKALRQLGHNVTVAVPRQPGFEASGLLLARRLTPLPLSGGGEVFVLDGQLPSGVQLTLFDAPVLFDRPGVYGEGGSDYPDNAQRFGLLAQAAASLVRQREQQGKAFDVVHLFDPPTALTPFVLGRLPGPTVPTVLTVFDLERASSFDPKDAQGLLPRELCSDDSLLLDGNVHVLKAGLVFANAITTASPSYAAEVVAGTSPLARVLAETGKTLVGVVNGLDYALYNPATDAALPSRYDAEDPSGKNVCKTAALRELELELALDRPLVLAPASAASADGFDLVTGALPALTKADLCLIVAGDPGPAAAKKLKAARARHKDTLAFLEQVDAALLRRLYAAADMVLVPARHAPSGTSQLIAQRYGAAPVARATGGIKDTVVDCDAALDTGTGFLFDEDSSDALAGAVGRALGAYASASWPRLVRRMMRLDLGWDRPARRYLQIYRHTLG
jgi:starch synthase